MAKDFCRALSYGEARLKIYEFKIKFPKMKNNSFNEKVYALLKKVPKGKVTTYKALAEALGTKAYRAVGQAMRHNPYAPKVPCHRVIASDGSVGGFSGTNNPKSKEIRRKIRMLRREGIEFKEKNKLNLAKFLFNF